MEVIGFQQNEGIEAPILRVGDLPDALQAVGTAERLVVEPIVSPVAIGIKARFISVYSTVPVFRDRLHI